MIQVEWFSEPNRPDISQADFLEPNSKVFLGDDLEKRVPTKKNNPKSSFCHGEHPGQIGKMLRNEGNPQS